MNAARVLIVEDDQACADGLHETLQDGGFSGIIARDPGEAVAAIGRDERIGVAVLDLGLPEVDGVRLLARLRAAAGDRGKSLQALLCSGSAGPADLDSAMRSGISAFLPKPIDRADFLNAVGDAVHRFARLERDRASRSGLIAQSKRLEAVLADVTREVANLTNLPVVAVAPADGVQASAPGLDKAWQTLQCRRLIRDAQLLDALLARFKIDNLQWRMLLAAHEAEMNGQASSATSIALACGTSESAGLRRLATLEKRGLVRRAADPADARRMLINLTEGGDALCREAIGGLAAPRAVA